MCEYAGAADVTICTPFLKMVYPVTPTLSVEAVQDRLICDEDTDVAARPLGILGGRLSAAAEDGLGAELTPESAQETRFKLQSARITRDTKECMIPSLDKSPWGCTIWRY